MHIIAMRRRIVDEHPWAARNLYNAFLESKRRSIERILDPAVSRYPVPWLATYARRMRDMFGGDLFPYGIEENRPTWEQMALYTYQQGIAHRHDDAGGVLSGGDHDEGRRLGAAGDFCRPAGGKGEGEGNPFAIPLSPFSLGLWHQSRYVVSPL